VNRPLGNPVFPIPQKVSLDPGATFQLDESCPILVPEQATKHDLFLARFLVAVVGDPFGLPLPIRQVAVPPEGRSIVVGTTANPPVRARCEAWGVDVSPSNPGPEGYALLGLSVVGRREPPGDAK
jgi:hypothetical protein